MYKKIISSEQILSEFSEKIKIQNMNTNEECSKNITKEECKLFPSDKIDIFYNEHEIENSHFISSK